MRQLNLFKGRRQRGERPPTPLEFELHCQMAELLDAWINPSWRYTHLPMGELRDPVTGARLKRMGTKRGWPDFMFVGPRQLFFLELKREGEEPSDIQGEVAMHIMHCGFGYFWTSSFEHAVGVLRDLNIVRARVSA